MVLPAWCLPGSGVPEATSSGCAASGIRECTGSDARCICAATRCGCVAAAATAATAAAAAAATAAAALTTVGDAPCAGNLRPAWACSREASACWCACRCNSELLLPAGGCISGLVTSWPTAMDAPTASGLEQLPAPLGAAPSCRLVPVDASLCRLIRPPAGTLVGCGSGSCSGSGSGGGPAARLCCCRVNGMCVGPCCNSGCAGGGPAGADAEAVAAINARGSVASAAARSAR